MSDQTITLHIDGHPGHRGNVLAYAFVERLQALLTVLSYSERVYIGFGYRKSDYEIVDAAKVNPTQIELKPSTKYADYNPFHAFNWTWEQINKIADGEPVDSRVDVPLAKKFADIVPSPDSTSLGSVWLTRGPRRINLDSAFKAKSEAIAHLKQIMAEKPKWKQGASIGSVVGELLQVDDIGGNHSLVIVPPVGGDAIKCTFEERHREKIAKYLFKTVRIQGKLSYQADSPYPAAVEIDYIDELVPGSHLIELRGILAGRPRSEDDTEQMFYGL